MGTNDLEERGVTPSSLLEEIGESGNNLSDSLIRLLAKGYSERYVKDKLVFIHMKDAKEMIQHAADQISRLDSLTEMLGQYDDLDWNWITAGVCFSAADVAIQKKANQLGIPLTRKNERGKDIFRPAGSLLTDIIDRMPKPQTKMKLFKVYSEDFRNAVIHRGTRVDDESAEEILKLTRALLTSLSKGP